MAGETPSRWDQVIVDMAPTGHALRLLEMPALIHDWTHALMRIVLKYQPVVGAGRLGQLLITLARRIGVLRRMLTDPVQTRFVVVTRAAALPRAETLRLKATLEKLGIDVPAIVVNAVGQGTCAACRGARAAERRELTLLTAGLRRRDPVRVLLAPAQVPAPEGRTSLKRWRQTWAEKPA
jgi:arsenite-transporting ATPase